MALLVMAAMAIFRQKPPAIPWITNHDEGVKQAREQHKPLLVAFMGDTPNSSWMERDCHHSQSVVDFVVKSFVPIWIDGDKQPALTAKYNVTAYPTYVIKWPEGDKDSRIVAHSSPSAFIEKMQTGLDRIGAEPKTR
ncbi:MAG: thioredoxin family protein [Sedimentisphaerales bacterium]|nr:thioredoxin family protein [Sedimentisphaerales bacterium]